MRPQIGSEQLLSEPWEETTALFVMPGGRDLPYCKKLNGPGNNKLRDYVHKGGEICRYFTF